MNMLATSALVILAVTAAASAIHWMVPSLRTRRHGGAVSALLAASFFGMVFGGLAYVQLQENRQVRAQAVTDKLNARNQAIELATHQASVFYLLLTKQVKPQVPGNPS